MDEADHVAYLGAFVVQGKLWRGDLFQGDDGRFVAEHTITEPDGSSAVGTLRIAAGDRVEAIQIALAGAFEHFEREGVDIHSMTVIHQSAALAATLH